MAGLPNKEFKSRDLPNHRITIQVAPDDCTGCGVCVDVCPAKSKTDVGHKSINMATVPRATATSSASAGTSSRRSRSSPVTPSRTTPSRARRSLEPLFEFSGACAGCGETPYLRLVTQLFGDRMVVANATGCSSIYGANLPTTPWATNAAGEGPAWANSLFEDNAEFGLGMRLALDKQHEQARAAPRAARPGRSATALAREILGRARRRSDAEIAVQRTRVDSSARSSPASAGSMRRTPPASLSLSGDLVRKGVWIIGGDGWAYDIGFGGLDQVLSSGRNVNILVLDTEVYSNTGGQASKATPRGAVAKFAAAGKGTGKKDLGAIARSYGNVFVAQVSMGANDAQTIKALLEAEAWDGPSLVIAYATCIAHGIDMGKSMSHQKDAVKSGYWPLYRYQPSEVEDGQPFKLDSVKPTMPIKDFVASETRFAILERTNPERAAELAELIQADADERWRFYEQLPGIHRSVPHLAHGEGGRRPWPRRARREPRRERRPAHPVPRSRAAPPRSSPPRRPSPCDVGGGQAARGGRRRGGGPALAVRGGDPPRGARAQPLARRGHGAVRRGPRLLPRHGVDEGRRRPLPGPAREDEGRRLDPGDRQPQRGDARRLGPLRAADAGRRRGRASSSTCTTWSPTRR